MKKVIKITEGELARIIKKVLTEMPMGVPNNITETASEIYNGILSTFSDIDPNSKDTEYHKVIHGDFSIKDYSFNTVKIEINIRELDDIGFKPTIMGAAIRGVASVQDDRIVNKIESELDILFNMVVGLQWNFGMIMDLFRTERPKYEATLSHELMHAFDHYNKPSTYAGNAAIYRSVQEIGIAKVEPINHFTHLLYFTHQTEEITRSTEFYSELKQRKITKDQFKKYFLNHDMIGKLKECRDYKFSKLVSDLHNYMGPIDEFLIEVKNMDTGYPGEIDLNARDIVKIHLVLDFLHNMLINGRIEVFHKMIKSSINPFIDFLPPQIKEVILNQKQKYLDKFVKDARKHKNYRDFFEYEIKKLNFAGDKTIKKLSKLYDMAGDNNNSIVNWDLHHKINKTSEKTMKNLQELLRNKDPKIKKDK